VGEEESRRGGRWWKGQCVRRVGEYSGATLIKSKNKVYTLPLYCFQQQKLLHNKIKKLKKAFYIKVK